tara:strand:+ start:95 stop:628 length:534 start_codon:yes stop_codon:yes gene_type:complete
MNTTMTTQQLLAQIETLKKENRRLHSAECMLYALVGDHICEDNIIDYAMQELNPDDYSRLDIITAFPEDFERWADDDTETAFLLAIIKLQGICRGWIERNKKEEQEEVEDDSVTYEGWKNETAFSSINSASWSKQSVKLLKRVCKERGLKKYSKLKKEELLRMLYLDEFIDPVETTN